MPRSRSIFIQSERVLRRSPLALTWPARLMAPPNSKSFSVSVVLPASGCEMMANVRRRATSAASGESGAVSGSGPGAGGVIVRASVSRRLGSSRLGATCPSEVCPGSTWAGSASSGIMLVSGLFMRSMSHLAAIKSRRTRRNKPARGQRTTR